MRTKKPKRQGQPLEAEACSSRWVVSEAGESVFMDLRGLILM
jgi:hypothetical protein